MLIEKQIAFALASRPVTEKEYERAQKLGFRLKAVPIGIDAIGVIVHPSLQIRGLTVQKFEDIYKGKITNWKQVGGSDLKIQPYGKTGRDDPKYAILAGTTTEL